MGQKNKNMRLTLTLITLSLLVHGSQQQFLDNFLTAVMSSSPPKEKEEITDIDTLATIIKNEEPSTNKIHNLVPIPKEWNPLSWLNNNGKASHEEEDYNPDTDLTTPELAIRHGYAAETYTVKTEDGYLLTMHRIPCGRNGCPQTGRGSGQPVFLQHGLLSSSADWCLSGPDHALAFLLADLGYDVWLGNARGNTYSRKHVSLSNEDAKFWDFSWHEMALYDIPAEIDFLYQIRNVETNIVSNYSEYNLLYIGHSMGTTMIFALLSMRPEYNEKVKAIFAMAPVAYMSNVKSPIRLLAPFSKDIELPLRYLSLLRFRSPAWLDYLFNRLFKRPIIRLSLIIKFFGGNQFLPQSKVIKYMAKYGCEMTDTERFICENAVFVLCGFDKAQYNATLMPVIFGHAPAGTSTKTVVHYGQEIHDHGNFQYFDYGKEENMKRYGSEEPPLYNLDNINVPIALFYATNDWLAGPTDVALLFDRLFKTSVGMFRVPFDHFNHVDFMWGVDAPKLVYKPVIDLMARYR